MSLPVVVEVVAVVIVDVVVDGFVVVIVEVASSFEVVLLVIIIVVEVVFSLFPWTKIKAPNDKTYNNHNLTRSISMVSKPFVFEVFLVKSAQ